MISYIHINPLGGLVIKDSAITNNPAFSTTIIFSKKDTEIIKRYFLGNRKYHESETELADLEKLEFLADFFHYNYIQQKGY